VHAGEEWTDVLDWEQDTVVIDDDGFGVFSCGQTSVSVWVNKLAEGRGRFSEAL
jgi:alpha-amylase